MIGAIPNPRKTITIDFPIEQVKVAARNIDKVMKFCHFREEIDEIANRLRAGGMTQVATFDGRTSSGGSRNIDPPHQGQAQPRDPRGSSRGRSLSRK